jgi:hypothetical protein
MPYLSGWHSKIRRIRTLRDVVKELCGTADIRGLNGCSDRYSAEELTSTYFDGPQRDNITCSAQSICFADNLKLYMQSHPSFA